MNEFLQLIKDFLVSTPGLIVVAVLAVLVILLFVLLIVALVKKHAVKKESEDFSALYDSSREELAKDKNDMDELNAKINSLTNDHSKLKKDYNSLNKEYESLSTELSEVKTLCAEKESEKQALAAELEELKKRKAAKKKPVERKPSVKKYSRDELDAMTKHELMTLCKTAGYDGFYHKSKEEVIDHILDYQLNKKKAKK